MEHSSNPKITVYRGWLDKGKYVWSPFVIKLEARLRFANVHYTTDVGSPRSAPTGKIPYVTLSFSDPNQSKTLSDSSLIIRELIRLGTLPDVNGEVDAAVRAQDLALRALMEDKLYFYHTYERWIQNYYTMRDHILRALPYPLRVLIGLHIFRNAKSTLYGQGTGRYLPTEILASRLEIWTSINDLLVVSKRKQATLRTEAEGGSDGDDDDEPFWILGGTEPTEADATVFGFVVSVLICTAAPDSRTIIQKFPLVLDYAERIHDRYFSDYEKWE